MYFNEKHNELVSKSGDIYIGTYRNNETLIESGRHNKGSKYIRIKCGYCDCIYDKRYDYKPNMRTCSHCCNKYENSFAYHIQVELNEPLNKYWDWEKNTVNPYLISKNRNAKNSKGNLDLKVWIKCTNESINPENGMMKKSYHGSYLTSCLDFSQSGSRCGYCNPYASRKIHPLDSLGTLMPDIIILWSDKNKKSPFDVAPNSGIEYIVHCQKCGSEYKNTPHNMNKRGIFHSICKKCNCSIGELKIKLYLDKCGFCENIDYVWNKVYFKDLVSSRGNNLVPDFILPEKRIWIEYDGVQHIKYTPIFHSTYEDFIRQQENDRLKNKYAEDNGWKLLRINENDCNKIETILNEFIDM